MDRRKIPKIEAPCYFLPSGFRSAPLSVGIDKDNQVIDQVNIMKRNQISYARGYSRTIHDQHLLIDAP